MQKLFMPFPQMTASFRTSYIFRGLFLLLAATFLFTACDDDETYADRRKREERQIRAFLTNGTKVTDDDSGQTILDVPGNINVISETAFYENDSTTDVSKNEYV